MVEAQRKVPATDGPGGGTAEEKRKLRESHAEFIKDAKEKK